MKVAVLSDLHLSRPGKTCVFKHALEPFTAWLRWLDETHDLLVVAGDLFDLDVSHRFRDHSGELAETRRAWGDSLLALLHELDVRSVYGNHDQHLAREGTPASLLIEAPNGRRLMVMHGHQFESQAAWLLQLKYTVKWLAGWDERAGTRVLGKALHAVNDRVGQPLPESMHRSLVTRGALRLLKASPDVDVLVCGHTHTPWVERTPWGIYGNSGTCTEARLDWLSIDLELLRVTVGNGFNCQAS